MVKLTLQLTYNTQQDYHGTMFTVAVTLFERDWSVERCWAGETAQVVDAQCDATFRISRMVPMAFAEAAQVEQLILELRQDVEGALRSKFEGVPRVSVRQLNDPNGFRFAAQIEVADTPGVLRDVLKTINRPGIYVRQESKEVVCRLDGLLCVPVYLWGLSGYRAIIDTRFRVAADLINKDFANQADLFDITEEHVCEIVHERLGRVAGVRRWSLLATSPHTRPMPGNNNWPDVIGPQNRQQSSQVIRYRRDAEGSCPGVAHTLADELFEESLSVRRAVISELDDQRKAGVFWVTPAFYAPEGKASANGTRIQSRLNGYTRGFYPPGREVSDARVSVGNADSQYSPDRIWISCQIEVTDERGRLAGILGLLIDEVDDPNPTGRPLNVAHLVAFYLYGSRGRHRIEDKSAFIEFLVSSLDPFPEAPSTHKMAVALNEWLFRRLHSEIGGVTAISCRPVRKYGYGAAAIAQHDFADTDIPPDYSHKRV